MKIIVVGGLIALVLILSYAIMTTNNHEVYRNLTAECEIEVDCAPATCCHASECVPYEKAPNCTNTFCTAVCEPGTMDCGQGRCVCMEGKCQAYIY